MVRIIFPLCVLAALTQCAPRKHQGDGIADLINGLAKERNDLILEGGTGIAMDNERTKEIITRGQSVTPQLRDALLNPSGKVAGYSAFCLKKLKERGSKEAAIAAIAHWQSKEPSFDNYFALSEISKLINSLK